MVRRRAFGGTGRERGRGPKEEDGAILVLWVVALTAIFGFVALAIDLGNDVQAATNIQNAADAAAIAGASQLPDNGAAGSEAEEVVASYIGAITAGDWASCTPTPPPPTDFVAAPSTPCIAFGPNQTILVEIPAQSIPSLFGSSGGAAVERQAYASVKSGQAGLCYIATTTVPIVTTLPGEC
jgi:uncharacterized membrane protein